jgi:Tfp pilus assembly protein PilF
MFRSFRGQHPSPESYNILGRLRMETGKYDEAVQNYRQSLQMKSDWGIVYLNLSAALVKQGKPDEAEKSLEKGLSISHGSFSKSEAAQLCNNLGVAFGQQNNNQKTNFYFSKAPELDPNFTGTCDNLRKTTGEK